MLKCATCDREFEIIPDDAIRLTHTAARTNVYRFSDGAIHSLRKIRTPKSESVPPPLEPPKEDTELLKAVVEVLAELPKPKPEIMLEPEVIAEVEEPANTTMAAAFRNFKS
jgi:hypothetical protein